MKKDLHSALERTLLAMEYIHNTMKKQGTGEWNDGPYKGNIKTAIGNLQQAIKHLKNIKA